MATAVETPVRLRGRSDDPRVTGCHVCMVVHSLYPEDPRVRREARAAVDRGHTVDIICMREPGQAKSETIGGVHVRRLPVRHLSGAGAGRMIREYLTFAALATLVLIPAAVRRRYDVVHVNNPPDFLIVAGLLPRVFGSRVILDIHDLSSHMFTSRFSGPVARFASWLLDQVELWATHVAHVVVTVHEPYRRELIAHGVLPEKLVVVMNVIDPAEQRPPRHEYARPRQPASVFTVAYAGTIAPWYGVELIVDAMALLDGELANARAVIFGGGDALDAVRARAEAKRVASRVEFAGWLQSSELLQQLDHASCGVIPNLPTELNRFALSTKLFEYIELGLPAVVARLETLSAHFCEDEVTFFTPGDAASLATALRSVAAQRREAEAKVQRARARVAREYSWEANSTRYVAAITGQGLPYRYGEASSWPRQTRTRTRPPTRAPGWEQVGSVDQLSQAGNDFARVSRGGRTNRASRRRTPAMHR
jgi:glycosyltransferase involved in cell wall biosynthesis